MTKKAALIILDGWGIGQEREVDAIAQGHTPYMDSLYKTYPHAQILTHGENAGLPAGQMGNSEVGHLNIGAGRIVYQELARINKAIKEGTFRENDNFQRLIKKATEQGKPVHLLGLLSDGGVHSHINHLIAICNYLSEAGVTTYIHAFMDGRDTSPNGGKKYLELLLAEIDNSKCKLSTVVGRYYAMDRDNRWERISKAYEVMVNGKGTFSEDPIAAVDSQYQKKITDEFMEPIRALQGKEGCISEGDLVLFANFRTDRPRQLTQALSQADIPEGGMKKLDIDMTTMTEYDSAFSGITVLYEKENLTGTLGEVVAEAGKTQLRIAETEKYPHVSFFFSGGRENEFNGESRILVSSPKVATYDLQPEMSAYEITTEVCKYAETRSPDLIVLNYANADMVGHTGDFSAACKAVETLDACMEVLVRRLLKDDYSIIVIADHGNSDIMVKPDGSAHTAHTTNPVPIIYINKSATGQVSDGILADIAPTLLHLMGLEKGKEMTGKVLVS